MMDDVDFVTDNLEQVYKIEMKKFFRNTLCM